MHKKYGGAPANSFTLVELLVVMSIMAILFSISIPAISSMVRGSNLTVGGNNLVSHLNLSRQIAMAKNCQVEVRFYELPDANGSISGMPSIYRAYQSFSLDNSGTQTNAVTKVMYLPNQICMSANTTASTLLTTNNPPYYVAGTTTGNSLGTYPPSAYSYMHFHFKPDGSTDLNPGASTPWYISLANQRDVAQDASTGLPANFVTIQVNAITGRISYFRPN